jgi:hypothetical protein
MYMLAKIWRSSCYKNDKLNMILVNFYLLRQYYSLHFSLCGATETFECFFCIEHAPNLGKGPWLFTVTCMWHYFMITIQIWIVFVFFNIFWTSVNGKKKGLLFITWFCCTFEILLWCMLQVWPFGDPLCIQRRVLVLV